MKEMQVERFRFISRCASPLRLRQEAKDDDGPVPGPRVSESFGMQG